MIWFNRNLESVASCGDSGEDPMQKLAATRTDWLFLLSTVWLLFLSGVLVYIYFAR
jgi:hypothetical protein